MSSHTPGPWRAEKGCRRGLAYVMSGDVAICRCYEGDDLMANAGLIAAAPDLLAACKQAVLDVEERGASSLMQMLKAAIAKAEGTAQ